MRDILNFFVKRFFFICFILLQFFSFFFSRNNFFNLIYKGSSLFIIGKIYQIKSEIKNYFFLKKINNQLIKENTFLKNSLSINNNFIKSYNKKNIYFNFQKNYYYIQANIIGNTLYEKNNYLTLDKGFINGVEPDMGIVTYNGVVGIITNVSKHFSTAQSLLNYNTKINVCIKRNKYFGTLTWDGQDHRIVLLEDIPKYVNILKGDIIETDGKSTIFPKGISIGRIKSYQLNKDNTNYKIAVKLFIDFASLNQVYIIKNFLKKEIENLKNLNTQIE